MLWIMLKNVLKSMLNDTKNSNLEWVGGSLVNMFEQIMWPATEGIPSEKTDTTENITFY